MPITQELTIRMENRSGFPGKVCRELVDQSVDITAFQSIPGEKTLLVCIVVDRPEAAKTWRFVRSGALVLGAIEDAELQHVHGLMSRHRDRPMDFADGTLVYLAKREFLSVILTVDHADFATYRIEGKVSSGYSRPITRNLNCACAVESPSKLKPTSRSVGARRYGLEQ